MSIDATQAESAARRSSERARRKNLQSTGILPGHTPGRLRWMTALSVAVVAVLLLVSWQFVSQAGDSIAVIGDEEGPRASSSAELYHALAEMDTQVAAIVLADSVGAADGSPDATTPDAGQDGAEQEEQGAARSEALENYEQRRADANRAVLETSSLTTGDSEAQATVQEILDGIGRYERLAAEVLLLSAESNGQGDPVDAEVAELYGEATDHMREEVLPKAYNLSLESTAMIRAANEDSDSVLMSGQRLVAGTGVVALGSLVFLQVFLRRRFRRRMNLPLLAATGVVLALSAGAVSSLALVATHLHTATDDGLDSEVSLAQARAISAAANGDQTRYLIDSERADTYEQTFLEGSQTVLYVPGENVSSSAEAARAAVGEYRGEDYDEDLFGEILEEQPDGMLGLLGDQANSEDLTAEQREGIENVLDAHLEARQADLEMRDADTFTEAARTRLDAGDGGVAGTHATYDAALSDLIAVHNGTFEASVDSARSRVEPLNWALPAGAVLAVALIALGVRPRIAEYTQNRRATEKDSVRNAADG